MTHLVEEREPDVICFQETKIRGTCKIRDYREITAHPKGPPNGISGTSILVRNNITAIEVDTTKYHNPTLEILGVDIHLPGEIPIRILNVHVKPTVDGQQASTAIQNVTDATLEYRRTFTIGDFNAKLDIPQHANTNALGTALEEKLEAYEVDVMIPNDYTRYPHNSRTGGDPSTLDFVMMNPGINTQIESLTVLPDIGSDHRPIEIEIPIGKKVEKARETAKPNFDKADWLEYQRRMREEMTNAPPLEPNKTSIDQVAQFITESIQRVEKETIPRIKIKTGKKKRELPKYIIDKIKERRHLRNRKQKGGKIITPHK